MLLSQKRAVGLFEAPDQRRVIGKLVRVFLDALGDARRLGAVEAVGVELAALEIDDGGQARVAAGEQQELAAMLSHSVGNHAPRNRCA